MRFFIGAALVLAAFTQTGVAHAAILAHYSFDSNYNDLSGNNRHGAMTYAPSGSQASGITHAAGEHVFGGGAMNFTEDRDYIALPSHTFSSGSPYSIAFWAKKAGVNDKGMVIGQRDNSAFFIWLNDGSSGEQGFRWRSSDSSSNRQLDLATPVDTDWHHYALVSTGTHLQLYVDNAPLLASPVAKTTGFIINTIGEAYNAPNNYDFVGQLDEVWIFNHALTAGEVNQLYTTNMVPEPSTFALAGLGVLVFAARSYRRRKAARRAG